MKDHFYFKCRFRQTEHFDSCLMQTLSTSQQAITSPFHFVWPLKAHKFNNLGCVKGLNQVGKALDRKDAYLCILAKDCEDPKYKKLITALAKQNKIPLIEVDSRQELGQWLGQCKYDKEGNARKTKGASSAAIKDYGEPSDALSFLEQYIKENDCWSLPCLCSNN